jgi:hypothetical protein
MSIQRPTPERQRTKLVIRAELVDDDTCRAAGFTANSHTPVLALCRSLIAAGLRPEVALEVFRAGTLALRVRSLAEGARLQINSKGTAFVCAEAVRTAPPAAIKPPAATGHRTAAPGAVP